MPGTDEQQSCPQLGAADYPGDLRIAQLIHTTQGENTAMFQLKCAHRIEDGRYHLPPHEMFRTVNFMTRYESLNNIIIDKGLLPDSLTTLKPEMVLDLAEGRPVSPGPESSRIFYIETTDVFKNFHDCVLGKVFGKVIIQSKAVYIDRDFISDLLGKCRKTLLVPTLSIHNDVIVNFAAAHIYSLLQ